MFSLPVPKRLNIARASLVALGSVAVALGLRFPLNAWFGFSARFSTFYWAIFLTAWAGGFWPGLLSTLLSILVVQFVLTQPAFRQTVSRPHDPSSIVLFAVTGTLISILFEALRNAHENSELSAARAKVSAREAEGAREREKTILESIADGFIAFDPEWRISYVNEPAANILGHPIADLLARDIASLRPNAVLSESHPKLRKAIQDDTPVHFEFYEGSYDRWFGGAAYPSPSGVSLFIRDITESRKLAEAVRESEERFRTMADSAPLPIWTSNRVGQRDYVNAPFLAFSGRGYDEELGYGWLELVHPEDLERVSQSYELGKNQHSPFALEYRMRRCDGVYRWFLDSGGSRFSSGGEYLGSVGSCLDITDRRLAEESLRQKETHLRLSMRASQTGTWHVDLDRGVLDLSSELEAILGLPPGGVRAADFALSIIHQDDRERVVQATHKVWDQGGEHELEYRIVRPDGKIRWLLVRGQSFPDSSGKHRNARGVAIDITERKQFEERFQHAQKLESLGILAGGIAHDFNNLLTGILGGASMVLEDLDPGSGSFELQTNVIQASQRAAQLTSQMLAYSGKGRFYIEHLDIGNLVRENLRLLQAPIQNKKIALKLNEPRESFLVEGDPSQMQQLVMNLVMNAAEAIPENQEGTIRVTIAGRSSPAGSNEMEPHDEVLLQVEDSGIGMDEKTVSRIFDPFFTTKFTGRGLGLAAVQGIVSGHKGTISVTSTPGLGTTFEVALPRFRPPARTGYRQISTPGRVGRGTILIVDDEELVRSTAAATLERAGYSVVFAEHGEHAIEVFQKSPDLFAAIVLDMTMPVMNGEEALPVLKTIRPDIKVIVCSGYSETEAVQRFSANGLDAFLQKPYTSARLAQTVRAITETTSIS